MKMPVGDSKEESIVFFLQKHCNYLNITIFVMVLGLILSWIFSRIKYHIKYALYHVTVIFLGMIAFLFLLLRPGNPDNIIIGQIVYYLTNLAWWFGIRIKVEGEKHLKKLTTPCVIMANHQTSLDFLVILKVAPRRTAALAKKELLFVPIFGQVMWLCGTVFVNRKSGPGAIELLKKTAEDIKRKRANLWIFPEGTRCQIDGFLPFKKGGFHLAVQAQIPVVPVVIGNYRNIIDSRSQFFGSGTISVKVLPPISTEGLTKDDVTELTLKCQQSMEEVFMKDFAERKDEFVNVAPLPRDLQIPSMRKKYN